MKRLIDKEKRRNKRKLRIRKKITGTKERPRITVYKSNRHLYAQVIDDIEGRTIVSVSTLEPELKSLKNNTKDAEKLGEVVGERMKKANIEKAVFDRNGRLYHGIVKAFAESARKAGIEF